MELNNQNRESSKQTTLELPFATYLGDSTSKFGQTPNPTLRNSTLSLDPLNPIASNDAEL